LLLGLIGIAFDSGAAPTGAKMENKMFRDSKISKFAAVTLLASFLPSVVVQAASLSSVQGKVQLSRAGGAFQSVAGPTIINPGDVVRAETGSSAQVVYANGSIASVSSGSTLTVAADPAAILAGSAFADGPGAGAASAGGTTSAAGGAGGAAAGGAGLGLGTGALVGGGLLLAGGTLLVVKKLNDDKKKKDSASP
jgi:hypothetical protein